MADTPVNDSALPPKLNLRKQAKPAAPAAPAPKKTPAAPEPRTSPTMRIKLPDADDAPTAATVEASSPVPSPSLEARPNPVATPGTARLKAKPRNPVTIKSPKVKKGPAAKPTPATPTAVKKPKSVTLRPAVGIPRKEADKDAPAGSKRETSKIPLETAKAKPVTPLPVGPRTIKIKPAAADALKLSGPVIVSSATGADAGEAPSPDPKRQTSRISLEAALGGDGDEKASGPKTIRLKRPSEAPTVRIQKPPAAEGGSDLNKTAQIEAPEDAVVPDTQKKTIKVKRPSQRRSVKSVSVKRSTTAPDASDAAEPLTAAPSVAQPELTTDDAHWTFITSAIAAMIVACVLIYVLCAQVLGPNVSLTELAYWAPDAELPWPGRISR
ncbi:MAG: hypothetical protein HN341_07190 [Verrucomicrobia bacterium]|jgi:hypothetical protein|nr:hypothetical protein [Verrucomicrobiota bacterium]